MSRPLDPIASRGNAERVAAAVGSSGARAGSPGRRPAPDGRLPVDTAAKPGPAPARSAVTVVPSHVPGPVPVGCECCGRLATAAAHLGRPAPAEPNPSVERIVSRYRRNADLADEPGGRSVLG